MLSQLLGCEAYVSIEQRIDVLGHYDVAKKSALLTDEKTLKEVIYRVQQFLPTDAVVEESSLATIKFEDIVCKDIPEGDRRLQEILLSQEIIILSEIKQAKEPRPTRLSALQ